MQMFAFQNDIAQFSKAINRFTREDPTFRVRYDDESSEVCFSVAVICFQQTSLKEKYHGVFDIFC